MILDTLKVHRGSPMVAHIRETVGEICRETQGHELEAVAEAVDAFLKEQEAEVVSTGELVALVSRAFVSLGHDNEARRLLLYGSGLVRVTEWQVVGHDEVWTLDLSQMVARPDQRIELVFFSCLHLVLEAIADVWDRSGGVGTVGLRKAALAARCLLGAASRGATADMMTEMKEACRRRLALIAIKRGWRTQPQVMDMTG